HPKQSFIGTKPQTIRLLQPQHAPLPVKTQSSILLTTLITPCSRSKIFARNTRRIAEKQQKNAPQRKKIEEYEGLPSPSAPTATMVRAEEPSCGCRLSRVSTSFICGIPFRCLHAVHLLSSIAPSNKVIGAITDPHGLTTPAARGWEVFSCKRFPSGTVFGTTGDYAALDFVPLRFSGSEQVALPAFEFEFLALFPSWAAASFSLLYNSVPASRGEKLGDVLSQFLSFEMQGLF
ncbi:hypothetical protein MUK42_37049, partial [Musa troglodytarum]